MKFINEDHDDEYDHVICSNEGIARKTKIQAF